MFLLRLFKNEASSSRDMFQDDIALTEIIRAELELPSKRSDRSGVCDEQSAVERLRAARSIS